MSCYFWPILTSLLPVTLCYTYQDPPKKYVTHPGPPIFSWPSTKIPGKSPLYKFSLNCSRGFLSGGFCQEGFCLEGFVRGGFCPFPLQSEYICYNRKVNITVNFMFHICMIKKCISVTSHAPDPPPPVTNCHAFSDPLPPSSVTYFMEAPITFHKH